MQTPGEVKDVKKKIHARARQMLLHGIGNFVWASTSGGGEVGGNRKTFSWRKKRAKGRVRLLRARGSAELRKGSLSFATQSLWLRNGKVGSQKGGID